MNCSLFSLLPSPSSLWNSPRINKGSFILYLSQPFLPIIIISKMSSAWSLGRFILSLSTLTLLSAPFLHVHSLSNFSNPSNLYNFMDPRQKANITNFLKEEYSDCPESMQVYYPIESGNYSVMLFVGGFTGNFPAAPYSDMLSQLANKGKVIIVGLHLLWANPLDNDRLASRIVHSLTWLKANLQSKILNPQSLDSLPPPSPLSYFHGFQRNLPCQIEIYANWSQVTMAGHSSGAKSIISATLEILKNPFKEHSIQGLVLLDPVDGDPLSFTKPILSDQSPKDLELLRSIPFLIFQSELCTTPAFSKSIPCCLLGQDGEHFWNLLKPSQNSSSIHSSSNPKYESRKVFYIMASHYGHADILDSIIVWPAHYSRFCKSVQDPKKHPFEKFRQFMSGSIAAFLGYSVRKDDAYLPYLLNQSLMPQTNFTRMS